MQFMIPKDFETWKDCIQRKCGIPLTSDFAKSRLSIYEDVSNAETRRFIKLYGTEHYQRVKEWFQKIVDASHSNNL